MTTSDRSVFASSALLRHACCFLCLFLLACSSENAGQGAPPTSTTPWIVVGIDGGEWSVIRQLWKRNRLPHLAALAERGVTAELKTRYNSSPVIWTTIATGHNPREHGIVDFVVATPQGDVPVSSAVRKVPALWNMLSLVERRVAVLGWWATWPAEDVSGVVVSDRALLDLEDSVSPTSFQPTVAAVRKDIEANSRYSFGDRDELAARLGTQLAAEDYDLLLVYLRNVDVVSHNHWKHFRPRAFKKVKRAEIREHGQKVPEVYETTDQALGDILASATPESNILVISDHGFIPAKNEIVKVVLNFDDVLERLGFQTRQVGEIDFQTSRLFTFASADFRQAKMLRYALVGRKEGGRVAREERDAIREELRAAIARIRYEDGSPAFTLRQPNQQESRRGADLVVDVNLEAPSTELLLDGDPEPLRGVIRNIRRISGTHNRNSHGIFFAAGPDIDPEAELEGISIHDIAPTLLYGLGLPVGEDFAGRAWTELFTESFRRQHPLRTIATWGKPKTGRAMASEQDGEVLLELGALGYLGN